MNSSFSKRRLLAISLLLTATVMIATAFVGCATSNAVKITRAEYGNEWPFTVDEGILSYDRGVLFTANGVTYAVNGTAMMHHPDLPKIEVIWADNPDWNLPLSEIIAKKKYGGPKKSLGPIIDRGLALRPE